jgi:hypothetical protein
MVVDTIISDLETAISALSSVNRVSVGLDLPDDMGNETYPAVFIHGGNFTFSQGGQYKTLVESGQFSLYIFVYDNNFSQGVATLNSIREDIIDILLDTKSLYFTGDLTEDRDATFKNIGEPYNGLPPFFCSRLDVPFNVPITDRR